MFGDLRWFKITRLVTGQTNTPLATRTGDVANFRQAVDIVGKVVWDRKEVGFEVVDGTSAFVGLLKEQQVR